MLQSKVHEREPMQTKPKVQLEASEEKLSSPDPIEEQKIAYQQKNFTSFCNIIINCS